MSKNETTGCARLFAPLMVMTSGGGLLIASRVFRRSHYTWNDIPISWVGGGFCIFGTLMFMVMIPFVFNDWRTGKSGES